MAKYLKRAAVGAGLLWLWWRHFGPEPRPSFHGVQRRPSRLTGRTVVVGPHEFFVVLDQLLDSEPFGTPPRILQLGTHHFSFWVDDVADVFERAVAAGFRAVLRPTEADAAAYGEPAGTGRVLTAIVKDHDGNPVQFAQRVGDPG